MGMIITNERVEKPQRTVLIVDDTIEDRYIYRRYLLKDEEWRYRVLEAETGEEALALCRESQPDCILLDYRLPNLNGLEVLAALAGDCEEAICPVVMLTAEEDIAVAVAALKLGAQDYLNKNTLTAVDLTHAVNNAVERVALRRENAGQRRAILEQNRKLEEALAASSRTEEILRRYELLSERARDIVLLMRRDGRIVEANQAAIAAYGYDRETLLEMVICDFRAPGTAPDLASQIAGADAGGVLFETRHRRKDGGEFPVEISAAGADFAGERMLLSIIRDITARKRAEEALRESEERYRIVAETASDAIITVDQEGAILLVNRAAEKIFGYSASELLGQELTMLMPDYLREMHLAGFKRYIETGARHVTWKGMEMLGLHRNGKEIPVEVSFGEFSKDGRHVFTGIIRDITERKRIEQERDLLLRREQQARQLAEDANRAKDEFLAVVTHELRSPLNAMLGYARIQCLKRHIEPEEARRAFETIRRNGERQKVMIDDLLDTARIITGKLRIEVTPVDLASVINDAIETVRPAADSKLILLASKLDPRAGQVTGDAERLQQVVWNLLSNAVKFTPEGGRVEVTLERVGPRVTLNVRDTGKGIEPDFLPRIFDRFTQQDTSHSRRYSGLGLGLALVKQLVEMHGGEIKATSAGEGQGATFTVTLPAAADKETRRQGDKETRRGGEESSRPLVSLSTSLPLLLEDVGVLIVDDEEDARTLVSKVLEDSGANVVAVGSATEAFAMIVEPPKPNWPDVLVCDIGMPEEDGYSLMRRIRDWERGRDLHLPSVALTALNRAEDRVNALGAGYKMHIAKPFEPEEVVTIVKSLATCGKKSGNHHRRKT